MYPEEKFYRLTAIAESLLNQKQYAQLRGMLLPLEPADVAQLMDSLSGESIPCCSGCCRRRRRRRYSWS